MKRMVPILLAPGNAQNKEYTWVLKIEDAKGNFVTADVKVNLSWSFNSNIGVGREKQDYKISIDKTKLNSATFKGPIKKISLSTNTSNPTSAENEALKNTPIEIKLKMKRYTADNILIGSYSSVEKNNLTETVGIGNKVSPSSNYPLDIAAGGNHLKMDNKGALSFGKVIVDSTTRYSNVTLSNELGLFIINFSTDSDDNADQYTVILSRATNGVNTYTTASSNGYRILCTSEGNINFYSNEVQQVVYIKKMIKIMSY